jgi:hypothetical protein
MRIFFFYRNCMTEYFSNIMLLLNYYYLSSQTFPSSAATQSRRGVIRMNRPVIQGALRSHY